MSKNKKAKQESIPQPILVTPTSKPETLMNNKVWMLLILAIVSFGLYFNSIFNDYCLDDAMMITQNSITQKGFAGINEHLNNDFLFGFRNSESHDAASSRWRPLSLITFSIEIGLWGANKPHYSHAVNVLLYALVVVFLFLFLQKFILKNDWLAFFTALLFAIHPVHTEVVANIKGRDELLSLLLLLGSLYLFWKFVEEQKVWAMLSSMLLFFISLTAKENAITFLAGVPVMLYFFNNKSIKQISLLLIPFLITTALYLFIRNAIVPFQEAAQSNEVMNNPFLYMQPIEKLATKFFILLLYFKFLVYPYPLCYDYSFNQIPPHHFTDSRTIISLLSLTILAIAAITGIKKKNIFSFCIIMFVITFSLSTNLVIEIGMTLGERLLFLPSIFFCIAIVFIAKFLAEKMETKFSIPKKYFVALLFIPIFFVSAMEIFARNKDWKNDTTLNIADIKKTTNSARINNGTGSAYVLLTDEKKITKRQHDSLIRLSIHYYQRAIQIHPTYDDPVLNMGAAYTRIDSFEKAEQLWNSVRGHSAHPKLIEYDKVLVEQFYRKGMNCGSRHSLDSAIFYLNRSTKYLHQVDSLYLECWYNVGGAYFTAKNYEKAYDAFGKVVAINPNYRDANNGYLAAKNIFKNKTVKN